MPRPTAVLKPLLFAPLAALAAEPAAAPSSAPAAEVKPAKGDKLGVFALTYGEYRPRAEIRDGASGSVRRSVWDTEVIYTRGIFTRTQLDLDYEAKITRNDFRRIAPYGDTQSHFFGMHAAHTFDSEWGAGLVGAVELAAEDAADLTRDGLRGGGGPTVMWMPNDSVSMETGALVQTQFGRDAKIIPYLKWRWAAHKNLDLEARVTGLQNGVAALWYLTDNKATSVRLSCFYETATYALRDGAGAEGVSTGEVPLRLIFTQFLNETVFVAARAEITLFHREGFYANNAKVGGFETGPAPAFGLLLGVRL